MTNEEIKEMAKAQFVECDYCGSTNKDYLSMEFDFVNMTYAKIRCECGRFVFGFDTTGYKSKPEKCPACGSRSFDLCDVCKEYE